MYKRQSQGSALGNLRGDFDNNEMADILGNGLGVLMDPVNSTEVTDYYQSKSLSLIHILNWHFCAAAQGGPEGGRFMRRMPSGIRWGPGRSSF